jgi:hypothetical protein
MGHAFGLDHYNSPLMAAAFSRTSSIGLTLDDKVAISTLYDNMVDSGGRGNDVAVGANGDIWAIGTNFVGAADYGIWKKVGSTWVQSPNGGARAIAVSPTGVPWVVNSNGNIYVHTTTDPTTGGWGVVGTDLARDIGIGSNGDIWIIGRELVPGSTTDFIIRKFTGLAWATSDGGGRSIAVGSNGEPWIVNSKGEIWRRTTNNPLSGIWEKLPGAARDIGISESPYAWVVSNNEGAQLFVWNQEVSNWTPSVGRGVRIAVGPGATPVYLDFDNAAIRFPSK